MTLKEFKKRVQEYGNDGRYSDLNFDDWEIDFSAIFRKEFHGQHDHEIPIMDILRHVVKRY